MNTTGENTTAMIYENTHESFPLTDLDAGQAIGLNLNQSLQQQVVNEDDDTEYEESARQQKLATNSALSNSKVPGARLNLESSLQNESLSL